MNRLSAGNAADVGSLSFAESLEDRTLLSTVSIVATDSAADENGPDTGTFTVSRTGSTSGILTVSYSIGGTATNGDDYDQLTGTVIIADGNSSATITVSPIADKFNSEGTETVILTLSFDKMYDIDSGNSSATVNIADAGTSSNPTVSISASDNSASEIGPDTGTFTVTRTGSTSGILTVSYSIGGTATNADDYSQLTGTVNIADGNSSATITVTPIADKFNAEGNETVILTLQSDKMYNVDSKNDSATVTIADDPNATVSVTSNDASASEYKSAGQTDWGTFTITRIGDSTNKLDVNYSLTGTATNGTDYETLSGTATIEAGNASVTVTLKPIADASGGEGNETAILTITSGTGYYIDSKDNKATVTIADNNPVTDISLDFDEIDENESTGKFIGELEGDDVDTNSKMYYTLISGDTSFFTISGNQLLSNAVLDYETKNSYKIGIRATDDGGLFHDKDFTITVNDVNDAPVIDNQTFTISRSHTGFIANLAASDQDAGQTLTFAITGGGPVPFSVSSSGKLEVSDPTTLSALTTNTGYNFTVSVTDNGSPQLNDTATIIIDVKAFEAQLTAVDFEDNHALLNDPTSTYPSGVAYSSLEWQRPSTDPTNPGAVITYVPVAYSSGLALANDRMQVSATFVITEGFFGNAKVRAFAANPLYNIPATSASTSSGGTGYDLLTLNATYAANDFEIGAAFLDDFTLTWEVSEDNGSSWITVGVSTHDIYVTYKDPTGPLYHTVVHVGTIGAAGALTDQYVIGGMTTCVTPTAYGIWAQFADNNVTRWSGGEPLIYDHEEEDDLFDILLNPLPPSNTEELLIYGHGQCTSWVDFLFDVLTTQGIDAGSLDTKWIVPVAGDYFLANHDWTFGEAGNYAGAPLGFEEYQYLGTGANVYSGSDIPPSQGYTASGYYAGQVGDYFPFHIVIVINGDIFDPSYGKHASTLFDWAGTMVQGIMDEYNGNYYVWKQGENECLVCYDPLH